MTKGTWMKKQSNLFGICTKKKKKSLENQICGFFFLTVAPRKKKKRPTKELFFSFIPQWKDTL